MALVIQVNVELRANEMQYLMEVASALDGSGEESDNRECLDNPTLHVAEVVDGVAITLFGRDGGITYALTAVGPTVMLARDAFCRELCQIFKVDLSDPPF